MKIQRTVSDGLADSEKSYFLNTCYKDPNMWIHNGTLQNGNLTKRYELLNNMCYKTVHVTKGYMFQNSNVTKRYVLQNSTCYKMVHFKTVHVTKWYVLQSDTC
jgi:hypothetical protein